MKKKAKRKEQLSLKRLVGLCKEIPDGRRHSGNWRHRLSDVLVICLLGMICGFETWEEIWDYAKAKRLFLWKLLGFRHGLPSPSTMRRVMGMIKPEVLENVYRQWVRCAHPVSTNPYRAPRHSGKVERQHRTDEMRFYSRLRIFSLGDGRRQLAAYQRKSNDCIMTCLGLRSPNQVLADYLAVV